MTLKEKIKDVDIEKGMSDIIEKIADDHAIEFAEWLSKQERTKFQCLSYCKKTIMWFTSKKGIGATTKELLEQFKKEKGL